MKKLFLSAEMGRCTTLTSAKRRRNLSMQESKMARKWSLRAWLMIRVRYLGTLLRFKLVDIYFQAAKLTSIRQTMARSFNRRILRLVHVVRHRRHSSSSPGLCRTQSSSCQQARVRACLSLGPEGSVRDNGTEDQAGRATTEADLGASLSSHLNLFICSSSICMAYGCSYRVWIIAIGSSIIRLAIYYTFLK
jgi:hypothetical protein